MPYGDINQILFCNGQGNSPNWRSSIGARLSSAIPYGLLCGGTSSSGDIQSISNGTANQVLTSNGPGILPSWQNNVSNTIIYDVIQFVGTNNYISTTLPNNYIMVYDCNSVYPIS